MDWATRPLGHRGLAAVNAENAVAACIIGAAIEVHRELGPGLFETPYEQALAHELELRGLSVQRQVRLPVVYKKLELSDAYRLDLLVNDLVIVEVKAQDALLPLHEVQLLTHLKFSQKRLGLLLNFHAPVMKQGIRRVVHAPILTSESISP